MHGSLDPALWISDVGVQAWFHGVSIGKLINQERQRRASLLAEQAVPLQLGSA